MDGWEACMCVTVCAVCDETARLLHICTCLYLYLCFRVSFLRMYVFCACVYVHGCFLHDDVLWVCFTEDQYKIRTCMCEYAKKKEGKCQEKRRET